MTNLFLMGASVSSDAAAGAQGGFGSTLIMLAILVAFFYLFLIRPQKKRDNEAKKMMDALKRGDKVVTIGGIRGTVAAVTDKTVFVKVDDNTKIEFTKNAISQVLNATPAPAPVKAEKKADKKAENKVEAPKAEAKVAEAPKAEVKVEAPKADEEPKAPAKKAPAKKAPAAKKAAPAKKAPAKKAAPAPKAPAEKASK